MLPPLQWLDRFPASYAIVFVLVALAAIGASVWADKGHRAGVRSWIYVAIVPLVLLAGRWPQLFVRGELNPDASQFLAGALTLNHDPVFWRSVDGMTAGPLVYYALAGLGWLGLPLNYVTERLVALGLLSVTLVLGHRLIAARQGARAAAFAVTPPTFFFALTTHPDFNHYSSELVPITLLSLAALLFFHPRAQGRLAWLGAGAFVAGLVPWAKLQAAPIAAALGLCALVMLAREASRNWSVRLWRILALIALALVPTALVLGMVLRWHSFEDFYRSYILQNLLYTEPGRNGLARSGSWLFRAEFATLGYLTLLLSIGAWVIAAWPRLRARDIPLPALLSIGAIMFGIGAVCVALPGRDFLHYTLLLLPGLMLFGGAAFGEVESAGRGGIGAVVGAAGVVCLALLRVAEPLPATIGHLARNYAQSNTQLGEIVKLLNERDRQVGVWGWGMEIYVDAASRQSTRSAYSYWEITPGPQRDYFRQRYLADLQRNRPPVFIDAVGEVTKFFQNRSRLGHETFPELAEFIARDYCLVAELRYARVYGRRDLLAEGRLDQKQIWRAFRSGRSSDYLNSPDFEDLNRFGLPKEMVGRRFAIMMRPPERISLPLDGSEREFRFGYGYLPQAELQLDGNGTELIVSVVSPDGNERPLRHVFHNPAHQPNQRGHRQLRVLLPPDIVRGSTLRIATGTGPDNDNAWDWLYLAQIGFVRSSTFNPRQFPAFNRPPDAIAAPLSTLTGSYGNPELMLHAPARLRFRLGGFERILQFSYGIRPGAYNGPSKTDGATFRVAVIAADGTRRVLFERTLRPAQTVNDRRDQHADLSFPPFAAGSELEIEIDPDGSNAWDWTYISSLRLG